MGIKDTYLALLFQEALLRHIHERICIVRKRECVNQVGNIKLTKNKGIENKVEK